MLNSHPAIRCEGEVPQFVKSEWVGQVEWLKAFYGGPGEELSGIEAIGMKTKLRLVADKWKFLDWIHENDVKVIRLYREDVIRQVISAHRADRLNREFGKWNLQVGDEYLVPGSIHLDIKDFQRFIKMFRKQEGLIDDYMTYIRTPTIAISYEELTGDLPGTLDRIFEFFGVRPHALKSAFIKATPEDISRAISNYDELLGMLPGLRRHVTFTANLPDAEFEKATRDFPRLPPVFDSEPVQGRQRSWRRRAGYYLNRLLARMPVFTRARRERFALRAERRHGSI